MDATLSVIDKKLTVGTPPWECVHSSMFATGFVAEKNCSFRDKSSRLVFAFVPDNRLFVVDCFERRC